MTSTSSNDNRIVVLIDMDCFFCQVETKLKPEYAGKPLAVVQYNQWKLGGIIAVNYEARDYGVTRHMRGEEAKEKCPDIVLASVPCLRGKADTSRYRSAGRDVINVIKQHCNMIERASVDEAYLDISDIVNKRMCTNIISSEYLVTQLSNTFVVGYSIVGNNDEEERSKGTETWIKNIFEELEDVQAQKLAVAGIIVEEIRADIYNKTGFRCSAGIAQNKILAKLACGLHKPNRQTILPPPEVPALYSTLPVKKVRNLGGKFGDVVVESLNCNVMGDLLQYSLQYLQKRFDDKTGLWLYNIARGIDNEPVTVRLVSKSIGACKKFPGKQAITSLDVLRHWAGELSAEVCERLEQDLEENERRATLVTICYHYYQNKTVVSQSRSYTLNSYKPEKMADRCVEIVSKSTQCPVAFLGVSAGKFVPAKGSENFRNFFKSNKVKPQETDNQTETIYSIYTDTTENLRVNEIKDLKADEITVDSSNKINNASSSQLKNVQSSIATIHLKKQISNSRTDWSPTSKRLNNLINSYNERNEKKVFQRKRIYSSTSNVSLDQNDFKESFFMNAFNSKECELQDACTSDNDRNMDIEYESLNKIDVENEEDNSELKLNLNVGGSNYGEHSREKVENEPMSSKVKLNQNNETNAQTNVKLEEIFPDLNNIDPTVVAFLPTNLQEEAKSYMKAKNKKENLRQSEVKLSKGKNKSKPNATKAKKNNDISNFLVKKDSSSLIKVPSKQCPKCYQMIAVSKYQEHCDFHLAESLQWEVNDSMLQNTSMNKGDLMSDINTNSIKRPANEDILKTTKSHKSMTSFLV